MRSDEREEIIEYAKRLAKELKIRTPILYFHPSQAMTVMPERGPAMIFLHELSPEELAHEMGHAYLFQKYPWITDITDVLYRMRPYLMGLGFGFPLAIKGLKLKSLPGSLLTALGAYGITTIPKLLEEYVATYKGVKALERLGYKVSPEFWQKERQYLMSYAIP